MVEVTQEVRDAAVRYWGNDNPPQELVAAMQAAFNAGRASVLAELESPTEAMVDGWIVGNGDGTKWRSMEADLPTWVSDPADAIRYARRIDAEVFHAEDEDAWRIVQFSTALIGAYKEAL